MNGTCAARCRAATHADVICTTSEQRYMRHDLTLRRFCRKHRDDHCVKGLGSPLLVVMVAVMVGPAAAEQKGQSCIFPPLGWQWQGKQTAAHQKVSSKAASLGNIVTHLSSK
ncbi:TPA: hypothetical protein ACH3X2_012818 [Trebouxia sp. C0005]